MVKLRDAVVYVDHAGNQHHALVIGIRPETETQAEEPAVNLLLIKATADTEVLDSGNWQTGIEKLPSIVHGSHESKQEYGRDCWLFEEELQRELPMASEQQSEDAAPPQTQQTDEPPEQAEEAAAS